MDAFVAKLAAWWAGTSTTEMVWLGIGFAAQLMFSMRFILQWIRDAVLRDNCPDTGCGIKVYWREAFLLLPFFTSIQRYLPALFQTYGYEVAYVPVNDRDRVTGQSKYSNLVRALVGLYDLMGVSWLRRRSRKPNVIEDQSSQ